MKVVRQLVTQFTHTPPMADTVDVLLDAILERRLKYLNRWDAVPVQHGRAAGDLRLSILRLFQ